MITARRGVGPECHEDGRDAAALSTMIAAHGLAQPAVERHAEQSCGRDDDERNAAIGMLGGDVEQPRAHVLGGDLQRSDQQRQCGKLRWSTSPFTE